jgi:hypothetical protein
LEECKQGGRIEDIQDASGKVDLGAPLQLKPLGGKILVEVEGPGIAGGRLQARIETAVRSSSWFPWARVGVDDLEALGAACGLTVGDVWQRRGRWFGMLETARR